MTPKVGIAIFPMLILLLLAVVVVIVLIKLCSKRPWIGGFIALGLLSLFALAFLFVGVSQRRVAHVNNVYQRARPADLEHARAIWLPGIEDEFEANKYASQLAAVRSLGLRIDKPIRQIFGDQDWPTKGIVFEGGNDRMLLEEFVKTAAGKFPRVQWTIEPETVAVQPDEVGIILDMSVSRTARAAWSADDSGGSEFQNKVTSGTYRASALHENRRITIGAEFVEKPWIENYYGSWNNRPNKRLIVAKSAESCLTEAEANSQAIADACNQLTQLLRQTTRAQATPSLPRNVTSNDILERDFIVDRFTQSFDGRVGKIWRQALLIDASVGKLEQLARHKTVVAKAIKWTWARMFGSVIGLLALITVVYAFHNAATKGYYAWSLRIAGIVLAAAVIFLFVA